MISRRTFAAAALALAVVPLGGARAADLYDVGGLGYRCAYASGKVPGTYGTAWIRICNEGGGAVYGTGTNALVYRSPLVSVEIDVRNSLKSDHVYAEFNPAAANQSMITGFVMDPGLNTAMIDVTVGTIHAKLTLNAKTEAPTKDQGASLSVSQSVDPSVCAFADAGAEVRRASTVASGALISSTKGVGGSLTAASGAMYAGSGAGVAAIANTSTAPIFFCSF